MDYRDFTGFTLQERRGIIAFLILALFCVAGSRWYTHAPVTLVEDFSVYYLSETDSLDKASVRFDKQLEKTRKRVHSEQKTTHPMLFRFDPNVVSEDSMLLLGMNRRAAGNLIRYREKGGKIRHLNQLLSIYGMDSTWVHQVADSIILTTNKPGNSAFKSGRDSFPAQKKKEILLVDLNSADSLTLLKIRGIGPYFAHKILNYRRRLGGYLRKSQLLEIPKISDSLYQKIEKNFYVDTTKINRIDINKADFKTFIRHPYFNSDIIQKILKYRKQNGPFEKAEHISRIRHLEESAGQKILPYLSPQ